MAIYIIGNPTPPATSLYPWDPPTPDEYVFGAKTDPGAGTRSNPLSPAQAVLSGPKAIGNKKIQWIGGSDYEISHVNPAGYRYPAIVPTSGAAADRMVIHQAEFPGSTDPAKRVRIRRTGGAGSILGFLNNANNVWDGFVLDTKTLLPETTDPSYGEGAQIAAWSSNNVKIIRCYTDHQAATYPASNRSNLFIQLCNGIEIGDSWFTNIGSTGASAASVGGNVVLVEVYDTIGLDMHNCELWNAPFGFWDKGQNVSLKPNGVHTHNIHHNLIHDCGIGIGVSNPIRTTIDTAVRLYQNIIRNCQAGVSVSSYGANEPKGIIIGNNLIYRCRRRNGLGEFYGFEPYGIVYINANGFTNSFASDCLIITRNNVLFDVGQAIYTHDTNAQFNNLEWDRNSYNTYPTAFWRQGEGGPTQGFSTWQGQSPSRDPNGLTGAQGFVDEPNDDMRPQSNSILMNSGRDFLNLLGQGTNGLINMGPFILPGVTDLIGPRLSNS